MASIDVPLKHGFPYHYKGEEEVAKFVTLSAFNMKQLEKAAPVKEIVIKAFGRYADAAQLTATQLAEAEDVAQQKADAEPGKIPPDQVMAIVSMYCADGDLPKLYVYVRQLLVSGVAYIDGTDVKLNGTYIDDLNPADFDELCGAYIGNFIL